MNTIKDIISAVLVILALIGIGFILGRCTKEEVVNTVIEYVPSEPIHDSIPYPVPQLVIHPIDTCSIIQDCIDKGIYSELFPERVIIKDSIIYIPESDTTEIVKDWATERYYEETLFNNSTSGKLMVGVHLQYNRLMNIKYQYDPIKEVVTEKVEYVPLLSPYIGASYGTFNTIAVRAGVYVREKWAIDYQFQYNLDRRFNSHLVGINYKF